MSHYLRLGSVPAKRHIEHRHEPGYKGEGIYYEEVVTLAGFARAYSIVYHLKPPTRVKKIEPAGLAAVEYLPPDTLKHVHLKTREIPTAGDAVTGRIPMFGNGDVLMSRCRPAEAQKELYRNATADEVLFIHRGKGTLHTHFGPLPFKPFDYVVIPRCTTYRVDFEPGTPADLLIIESTGTVGIPPTYLNPDGQVRLGAPYSERDLHGPTEIGTVDREADVPVLVKADGRLTRYIMSHHPFDVVGWDGFVYPYTFNADDFEPITGTIHQPPPIHQTFEAPGFVICTFAPRYLDHHPQAIKVPYAHSNVECDEVLYYVRGHFGSRRGVEESSFTLHPRGIPHGPHPGTIVASRPMTRTDELAVMLDTFRPLHTAVAGAKYDDPSYPYSWVD
ncbi:MAG: homogentisate 1,2-dioxygenase [Gemmataceae bacterium]|nr:homogentisate 1,2-dioxygenase [Gemmataceae bacterium]